VTRSAAHQERALDDWALPPFDAAGLPDFYGQLDSTLAKRSAAVDGCAAFKYLSDTGGNAASWATVLGPILAQPASNSFLIAYAQCGVGVATDTFGTEIGSLVDTVTPMTAGRLIYLMSFDYGPAASIDALGRAAADAPSLQLRELAISRLSLQAQAGNGYSAVPPAEAEPWKELFRDRLAEVTSGTRFRLVWRGINGLSDDGALALAGEKLRQVPLAPATQRQVVCDAYRIAVARRLAAWTEFQDAAQPWTSLAPEAAAVLADPARCGAAKPRATIRRELHDSPAVLRAGRLAH